MIILLTKTKKMIEISGKLLLKSEMITGVNANGEWKSIDFVIQKTFQKVKYSIPFSAKGKVADYINSAMLGQRMRIAYIPIGVLSTKQNRWFCNNKAISAENWVSRKYNPEAIKSEFNFTENQ